MNWTQLIAAYQQWLEHSSGRSPATVTKYGQHLRALGNWYDNPPEDPRLQPKAAGPTVATTDDLELFTGLLAHQRGMSPRSRSPMIAALKSFYRWASRRAGLGNPAANLVYPEIGRRLPVPASLETAEKLMMAPDLDTFIGLRDAAILATLIGTGMRVSGLISMNESSLLWSSQDGKRYLDIKVREKGNRERVIPAPIEAQILIRTYLAHPEMEQVDRLLKSGDKVLWINTKHPTIGPHDHRGEARRLKQNGVRRMITRHAKRAGLPPDQCHPHAFRHLFGTELAEHDIDPWMRQALMGHQDIKHTEVYTHLAARKLRQASDKANPLRPLRAPVLDSAREIYRRRGNT